MNIPPLTPRQRRPATRSNRLVLPLLVSAFLLGGAGAGRAQQKNEELTATLVARKIEHVSDGREKLVPADTAKPGDTIQYEATYKNQSAKELRSVQPTLPIPAGSEYTPHESNPVPASASLDGATFAPYPLKRKVATSEGKKQEVNVPLAEYRALRWTIGSLAPGAEAKVAARVRLSTNSQTAKR